MSENDEYESQTEAACCKEIDDGNLQAAANHLLNNPSQMQRFIGLAKTANRTCGPDRNRLAEELRKEIPVLQECEAIFCAGWGALVVEEIAASVPGSNPALEDMALTLKLKRALNETGEVNATGG